MQLTTRLAVSEWMLILHSCQITCVALFWIKSSLYSRCIKRKLQERYNIRTSDETMSYTFIANSLYPLEIIFQLLKEIPLGTKYYKWIKWWMSEQGDLKPFQWISEINPIKLIIAIFKEQDNLKQNTLRSKFILMASEVSLSSG